MRFALEKDGKWVNDIICEPDFVAWYAEQHGYTYHEVPDPPPVEPTEPAEMPPTEMEQLRADVDYLAAMTGVDLM